MHGSLQRTFLSFLRTLKKNLCFKGGVISAEPEFVHGFDWYTTLLKHVDRMHFLKRKF